jgi:putative redox protein
MSAASESARAALLANESGGRWVTARTGVEGYRTDIEAGGHALIADESGTVGGSNAGPSPYELLLSAIGSCTAMTMRMYASRKQWPLEDVTVRLRNGRRHAEDCANCEKQSVGIQRIERQIEMKGDLTDEQRERLLAIAERCPVKQTLTRGIEIVTVE